MTGDHPLTASGDAAPLSAAAVADYEREGYLLGLPVMDDASIGTVQTRFRELLAKLPAGTDINTVNCWHKANRWMYELSRFPPILDYVEGVLGSDFYCWGAQFFCKLPAEGEISSADNRRQTVPWHQDGQYWPLQPLQAATVWLAVFDTDAGNGAMKVVAGSHRDGAFEHRRNERADYVLEQEIPAERIDDGRVVSMDLRAGRMSLHDIGLVHGSTTSRDGRPRVGTDLSLQPHLRAGRSIRVAVLRSLSRARHGGVPATRSARSRRATPFRPTSSSARGSSPEAARLAFRLRSAEADLPMGAVTERLVARPPAAAERHLVRGSLHRVAARVQQGHRPADQKGSVVADRDLDICHPCSPRTG